MRNYTVIELGVVAMICLILGGLTAHACFRHSIPPVPSAGLVIDGQHVPLAEGAEVEVDIIDYESTGGRTHSYRGTANAASQAVSSWNSDNWTNRLTFTPPSLQMDGAAAAGTGLAYKARFSANSGHVIIIGIGALLFVAGVVAFIYWSKKNGVILMLAGILLAAVGYMFNTYPILTFIIPAVAVGAMIYYWYGQRKAAQKSTALEYIVAGVEKAGEAGAAVKAKIAEVVHPADARAVKAVVTEVKANS